MAKSIKAEKRNLNKAPTGIEGLDQITGGGLPQGRPTLICGGPGCGKSLLGIEFLIRGATKFGQPGVIMTFEESDEDIRKNVSSLGLDLDKLIRQKKVAIDYVKVDRSQIDENGEYDLEALFIRIGHAISQIGARRVLLDTIESLFSGFTNQGILRTELRRLFSWLKERGITTVITGERGEGSLTRQGLEEYVSDCVILLDHRTHNQISTRLLRIVKYRGSTHGTNEYPFLIDEDGISVLPVTSMGLAHQVSNDRVSSGLPRLDAMLGGKGIYRGSSVLISGTAGTGKSTVAAHYAAASCKSNEPCVYFAFEESQHQIVRNMKSIGLNLEPYVKSGLLHFYNARPTMHGLEMHLAMMHKLITRLKPRMVVIDPISNFASASTDLEVHTMLVRLVDFLKSKAITGIFTNLADGEAFAETTDMGISSIMDTWILLRDIELGGERNRGLYILKSRGMSHSNQIREFLITPHGIDLLDVYTGPDGVLTGSARVAREATERAQRMKRRQEITRKHAELAAKQKSMEAQIEEIRAQFIREQLRIMEDITIEEAREMTLEIDRENMGRLRHSDAATNGPSKRRGQP